MTPVHSPARAVLAGHAALLLGEVAVGRWLDTPPSLGLVVAQGVLGGLIGLAQIWRSRGRIATPEAPAVLWLGTWLVLLVSRELALPAVVMTALAFAGLWLLLELLPKPAARSRPELIAVLGGSLPLAIPFFLSWHFDELPVREVLDAMPAALTPAVLVLGLVALVAWLRPQVAHWSGWAVSVLLVLPPAAPPAPDGPGILLITIDTLRSDDAAQMELTRRLAERGEVFTDALSSSSWTIPALASVHTGRWAAAHGAGRYALPWLQITPLSRGVPTLAEHLRDAGWHTGAVLSNGFVSPAAGFDRGFVTFDHDRTTLRAVLSITAPLSRLADGTLPHPTGEDDGAVRVDHALEWLSTAQGPWFLWVHLIDPHLPYAHATLAAGDPLAMQVGTPDDISVSDVRRGNLRMTPAAQQSLRDAYRQEVAHVDAQAVRLLDGLDALGLTEQTSVLFTSDHGEEFWEHGGFEHGHALVPEVVQVPLIWARPGGPVGTRSDPASLVDIAPTLLAAAGVPLPPDLDGFDLSGQIPADRIRLMENTLYFEQRRGAVRGDWVWVQPEGLPGVLFDRRWDPRWLQDLSRAHPEQVVPLRAVLEASAADPAAGAASLDRTALEALGYLEPE